MKLIDRRSILGSATAAGTLAMSFGRQAKGSVPSDKVVLAVIGVRDRGIGHLAGFAAQSNCEVVYICDVDSQSFPAAVGRVEKAGAQAPKTVADMRPVFDDPAVNAVVIATPDRWHNLGV